MNILLFLICLWSLTCSIYYLSESITSIIAFEIKKFFVSFGMFMPFAVIWIDAFLRIFVVTQTGLW